MHVHRPQIALLIPTSSAFGRNVLHGIGRFLREHGDWSCFIAPGDNSQFPRGLSHWKGHGVIADIRTESMAADVAKLNLPTANVGNPFEGHPFPLVRSDDEGIGRVAALHFIEKGFRRFAYFGDTAVFSEARGRGFANELAEHGHDCEIFWPHRKGEDWARHRRLVREWVANLDKPIAILTMEDNQGRTLLAACQDEGVKVPEEVAIVGVDDDAAICDLLYPPLSSVDPAADRRGYEAARLLQHMLDGQPPPAEPISIPPRGVMARMSSDSLAVEDREVAKALAFIRDNATQPILISHVANHVLLSRRMLEMRFRKAIGRLPGEELRRVRLERAKRLLIDTDLKMVDIARRAGFASVKTLSDVFARQVGCSPSAFRHEMGRR